MADRLPLSRVVEIAGMVDSPVATRRLPNPVSVDELTALAREVVALREAVERLTPTLQGKPGCKACGGAGWYQWTAGDKTTSEVCECRAPDGEGAKDG